jgi:putative aldouronate transport system permease protein
MLKTSAEPASANGVRVRGKKSAAKARGQNAWAEMVRRDFKVNKSLYLMAVPILAFYVMFHYAPMYGALIAFKNFKPQLGILGSGWAGWTHFQVFFSSPSFAPTLVNTLRISFAGILFGFPAPILLALLLNELRSAKFAKLVQNITYMPHFISLVVICGMIRDFTYDTGVVNYVLGFFGHAPETLLNFPKYFVPVYVWSEIWQTTGWGSIIYLAALTAVDAALYEAAEIDGANRFRKLIHITLPCIMPTIVIMLILRVGNMLNVGFEKIILLYNDSTLSVADVISTYVYRKGLLEFSWSFSSAVGLFNSVINFAFLIGTNYICRKTNNVGLW